MATDPLLEARSIVAEFAAAADEFRVLMPDVADVQTPTTVNDDHLGTTRIFVTTHAGVQCRRTYLTGREAEDAARTATGSTYRFTFPLSVKVTVKDVIVHNSLRYEVLAVTTPTYAVTTSVLTGDGRAR